MIIKKGRIERSLNLDTIIFFDDLIMQMSEFKNKYPNGKDFYVRSDYFEEWGDTYSELHLVCDDIETDEEFEERCKHEENKKEKELERKRAEFERLKKELGEE